jgi:hypothetical protein
VIDDLKAEGYDVQINWLTGFDTEPVSVCIVTNVNTPGAAQRRELGDRVRRRLVPEPSGRLKGRRAR